MFVFQIIYLGLSQLKSLLIYVYSILNKNIIKKNSFICLCRFDKDEFWVWHILKHIPSDKNESILKVFFATLKKHLFKINALLIKQSLSKKLKLPLFLSPFFINFLWRFFLFVSRGEGRKLLVHERGFVLFHFEVSIFFNLFS